MYVCMHVYMCMYVNVCICLFMYCTADFKGIKIVIDDESHHVCSIYR